MKEYISEFLMRHGRMPQENELAKFILFEMNWGGSMKSKKELKFVFDGQISIKEFLSGGENFVTIHY